MAAPLVERAEIVVHFAAETHVDRSIQAAGDFIRPTCSARSCCSKPRAARRTSGGSSRSRPTRSTAAWPTGASRETDELKPRNPYSASKAGADRLAYSYFATYGLPVIITRASNNYGPYQFPEKVIPLFVTNAIDEHAAAALRRRPERPRLAARRRPLPRARPADRDGHRRRGLQRRRRQRGHQRRSHAPHPRPRRPAALAHPAGAGSAGPRSPVLRSTRRSCASSAGRRRWRSTRASRETVDVVPANEWWWRPIKEQDSEFRAYYERAVRPARTASTRARRPVLVTGAAGFAGSHLLDLLATTDARLVAWSHRGGHHKPHGASRRRGSGGRARRRPASIARSPTLDPICVYHLAGDAQSGGSWRSARRDLRGQRARHAAPARRGRARHGRGARRGDWLRARLRSRSTRRSPRTSPLEPAEPVRRQQARAGDTRPPRRQLDGLDVIVARPFNHVGPRQIAGVRRRERRAADRAHRGRATRAAATRRQPRRRARFDGRSRHRARAIAAMAAGPQRRASTTSVADERSADADCSCRRSSIATRVPVEIVDRSGALPPRRRAASRRRSQTVFARRPAGRRRSRSSALSTICSNTGDSVSPVAPRKHLAS